MGGCTTGTGSCADAAEKALNDTAAALTGAAAHTRRSCDTTKALGSLAQADCAAATLTVGCTTGTGSCADAAEKALNDTAAALTGAAAHTRRSRDTTKALGSLAQGACAAATLTAGCTTGTGPCADQAEKDLNVTAAALTGTAAHSRRSCDTAKALGSLAQGACAAAPLTVGCTP